MMSNRNTWEPDERAEYDELMERVISSSKNTRERLDLFERLLNDAVQAHRPWAREVERQATRAGLGKEIKAHQDRNRAHVSHDGVVLDLPSVQARRIKAPTGEIYHQRELIEMWTWEQIEDKRTEALHGIRTYTAKIAHYDILLALRDLVPTAKTPAEAVAILGTTIDQWLGGKGKAA